MYFCGNYIEKNFGLFVEKYNESSEEELTASYVENSFEIMILDHEGEKKGYFLDFDYDNGYALVGDEYVFYDFAINGESPYKEIDSESYCYCTVNGYLYLKDGEYVNVDESKNLSDDYLDTLSFSSAYNGQTKAGCGHITDTDLYVEDKYGAGWSNSTTKSVKMATGTYTTQMSLSCYHDYSYLGDTLYYSSEGNCWFVSAYNLLQSLADATGTYKDKIDTYKTVSSKTSMPSINNIISYDVKKEEYDLYKKYYDDNENNVSGQVTSSSGKTHYKTVLANTRFPELYTEVRKYVVTKYGKVDDGSVYNTANIIDSIGKQYGYNFKTKGTVAAGIYGSSGITAINNELPFVLCVSKASNAGYGNHLMAGCGYKTYSKTSGWWIFQTTSYKYFYELRDGHSASKIYFDLTAWTGFGGIVMLDYSIFNY